ncbi:MAG: hypothetical protein ROR55_10105 [Devosia sp.]
MRHAVADVDPAGFDWPSELVEDFRAATHNGCVGHVLVSETERVRIWSLRLAPGERIGFHIHVLDYFWTAVTPGKSLSHMDDGQTVETTYAAGDTKHFSYGPGEFKIHDLENIGNTDLVFTTVEFFDGANNPLPVPDSVRKR